MHIMLIKLYLLVTQKQDGSERFLCGLHELYSHIMLRPNLYIYLFVYESRACHVV